MNIRDYNRDAWNRAVGNGNQWTIPVGSDEIERARAGEWQIILTPTKPVPRDWYPAEMKGADILCLASGGGQQGPILAATGANVTVFDNSPAQLAQDRLVAERDGLAITTIEGDMADLSVFPDETFDLIVHPCSNVFVPDILPVWREAFRVLRPGGALLAGFTNPVVYIFDQFLAEEGIFQVKHSLPYSDLRSITDEERNRYVEKGEPLEFGHTLEHQIGGQLAAGFHLVAMFEDYWANRPLAEYMPTFIATRSVKPG
jgi:SAM-dependent methyltransferase